MASGGLLNGSHRKRRRLVGSSSLGRPRNRLTFFGLAGFSCQVFSFSVCGAMAQESLANHPIMASFAGQKNGMG